MAKPCRHCKSDKHTSIMCFQAPRKKITVKSTIKRMGKKGAEWVMTRHEWKKQNPPNHQGYYFCEYCHTPITDVPELLSMGAKKLTLDHVRSRTHAPELRATLSNLVPACWECNQLKASKEVESLRV